MANEFKVKVILHSGEEVQFDHIKPGEQYDNEINGIHLSIGTEHPYPVTATPKSIEDPIKSIEYDLFTDMKNYHKVIIPESGRWYINMLQMVSFWSYKNLSAINDFKMPLYIFTGQDLKTSLAFGVIGRNYETSFKTVEPEKHRALIVYMRRLSMQIKRGTDLYPIPSSIAKANDHGRITEHLYYQTQDHPESQPWLLTLRDFAEHQKRLFKIKDFTVKPSMYPLWCSWTDWFSDDVTDEVILDNVKAGVELGIKNFIIDDGWFGPGLDNDFDVQINIGDWEPDPAKIKDMSKLVQDVKSLGGVPLIWCAPHAVAEAAECFEERKKYLIRGDDGKLALTSNKFHCLCFMNPEAREIMAEICASFITKWDFDGAKYDLFNCVPPMIRCTNPDHNHDTDSMMEGLELTLKLIEEKTRALKKDYIVELKQNYGTPFLSQYGTMTRAGDTPYNTDGNFLRTVYVQGYSPFAVNDYQTITSHDSPESAACIVIKMSAVGIPSYSIDFSRLTEKNKQAIKTYSHWYNDHVDDLMKYRLPLDGENNGFKIEGKAKDIFFLVNESVHLEIDRNSTILNGTFKENLFIKGQDDKTMKAKFELIDCQGQLQKRGELNMDAWTQLAMLPGSRIEIILD